MYKSFFSLTRNPFDLTPDPTCLVSTRGHDEALAALYYGIRSHKGFVVLTGEVGTGKTLLLRCLLGLLKDSQDISSSYLFNSRLSSTELLQYILADLGMPSAGKNRAELLLDFGRLLVARASKGLTTVLIVDEAHHLSEDLLEEIRLLSNFESNDDKLLQIVLVGQPELNDKLDSVSLRQLKQRISLRAHLGTLDSSETMEYIGKRLQIAGADPSGDAIFPIESIAAIYGYSHGIPRLINTLCENGLIAAYARQSRFVTPEIIDDVARDFHMDCAGSAMEPGSRDRDVVLRREANLLFDSFVTFRKGPDDEIQTNVIVAGNEQ